ncbi:hypothetical protein TNCV_1867581 [Trichonephila clavipes]|nr:hypothetical protein TNCV_1867581 [Trichonephila clavipes]
MKVRRELDCKLNLDSKGKKIPHTHCEDVYIARLQTNHRVSESGTHPTGLRAYRSFCPRGLYMGCLDAAIPVAVDSLQDRLDAVLCLLRLAVTAKY